MSIVALKASLRPALRRSARLGLIAALALTAACGKDKPKADEAKKTEPTPVPSDLVFNDFLPPSGNADGLGVRDAGLEGGLAAIGADEGPGAAAEASSGGKAKVVDAGAEPRAVRKYAFAPGRVDKRVLTISQAMHQSVGSQSTPPQEVTLKLHLDLATKQVKPSGATIEAKVTKVEMPGAPPQAAQMLSTLSGLGGTFDVTPRGDVGEVSFVGSEAMRNQLAESVVQGISQAVQLLLVPLPDAPIGAGAKWEIAGGGDEESFEQGARRFTLKSLGGEGAVVDVDIDIKVPRRAVQGPRGGMAFVAVEGKGHYTYDLRFDRTAPKVEGELAVTETVEAPDPSGAPGGAQTMTQTQKAKHRIETPK